MSITVAEMTKEELHDMIDAIVDEKLRQLFAEPDEEMQVQDDLRDRLLHHQQIIAGGERGKSLDDVLAQLGLD